jgi:hypothetical protein
MCNGKKGLVFLLFLFFASFNFGDERYMERMLIMGWTFAEEDTSIQTNIAIDAMVKYAEAAKTQMNSYERFTPSCKIELYRVYKDNYYEGESFEDARVYVYINSNVAENGSFNYHDRYIEIDFYIIYNGMPSKYKLVLYYNGYNWLRTNKGNNRYELVARDDNAYDFFIAGLERLRRY